MVPLSTPCRCALLLFCCLVCLHPLPLLTFSFSFTFFFFFYFFFCFCFHSLSVFSLTFSLFLYFISYFLFSPSLPLSPFPSMAIDGKYIGLILAISSSLLIGASFVITKKGLQQSANGSQGRTPYLTLPHLTYLTHLTYFPTHRPT